MRTSFEMTMMLVVTGATNVCMFPAIYSLYHRQFVFEAFIGMFTMVTSFMYHVCDSIDGPLWLTEGQWHRLDNVGSIMSFVMWIIHLMDLRHPVFERYVQYFFLAIVLMFQEKNPWDDRNSVIPIVSSFAMLLISFTYQRRVPKYNLQQFRRGLLLLLCGIGCFVRGLDDDTDPFRFFHGCWHGFVGAAAYYNFKVLPDRNDKDPTPDFELQQSMSLVDRLYTYDLTWSTKLYHRFGRYPTPRLCWEIFSHSGDGFL
ncbi:hypothetical protein DD237_003840 [Peronospora effusa]|uniref:Post-GPI attachment to proteins factor 3 n=1 Tax=Peronospora effusa TaxID=542832 RepID=A0A3R7W2S7_9STRA|nr:hypothetical protein DD237_003840 [Peronospora effusa]